ncbi:MAG: hypothetical protein ACFE0S_12625 [Rhodospirillales bacterium]
MRKLTSVLAILSLLCWSAALAAGQGPAVTKINADSLIVYERNDGGAKLHTLKKSDIELPAVQVSNVSDYGLIKVVMKRANGGDPVVGWILRRFVDVDEAIELDIPDGCSKGAYGGSAVARGTRGLGGC